MLLPPYDGIRHDSILYLGQALQSKEPSIFSRDLFFASGSQASYTIFPHFASTLIAWFEPAALFMWLTLVGRIAFLFASWSLARRLGMRGTIRSLGLLALMVMPAVYSNEAVFRYGELFFTARSIAEPLSLLSLAAMIQRQWAVMGACWILAALMHPVQALPPLFLAYCWACLSDRRWLILLVVVPLVALLPGAFHRYDLNWWSMVDTANSQVVLSNGAAEDLARIVWDLLMILLVGLVSTGVLRRFAWAVALMVLFGLSSSLVLADILHLVWPTGLQLWRVQWLGHWFAVVSLPWLVYRQWQIREEGDPRFLFLSMLALLQCPVVEDPPALYGISLAMGAAYAGWPWFARCTSVRTRHISAAAIIFGALTAYCGFAMDQLIFHCRAAACADRYRAILIHPAVVALVVAIGAWMWTLRIRAVQLTMVAGLAGATLSAAASWDGRSEWAREIETRWTEDPAIPSPFGLVLEPTAQVLWQGQLLPVWLVLQRASYLSGPQLAGALFNRGTYVAANERLSRLSTTDVRGTQCLVVKPQSRQREPECSFDARQVRHFCSAANQELNYVVLSKELELPVRGQWTLPVDARTLRLRDGAPKYWLYACSDIAGLSGHSVANSKAQN